MNVFDYYMKSKASNRSGKMECSWIHVRFQTCTHYVFVDGFAGKYCTQANCPTVYGIYFETMHTQAHTRLY